jgi:glycosyltransferase involved in cell wall biosynthesis
VNADRVPVVQLVSTLRRAGPTSVVLDIVRHLDRGRYEPLVVTLSPEPPDSLANHFRAEGVPVESLAHSRARGAHNRHRRRDIEGLLGRRLDARSIVHSHGVRSDAIASTQLRAAARLATAHNFPYDDYPLKYGVVAGRWMAWRHLRALRRMPLVVACSSALAERLRRAGVAADFIRNGVDTRRFRRPSPDERAESRRRLGLPANARVVACVGTLSPRKRPLEVARAARLVDDPTLLVVFAGGGPLEAELRRAAGGDGRIRLAGELADVSGLLRASDAFVSASASEGLPIAALEAVACGLGVVLSDIAPHRELLGVVPSAGELYEPGDVEALTRAIGRAAGYPRAGSDDAAVREEIGAETMARRYQEIYSRIAAG